MADRKTLKVTLVSSLIGRTKRQRDCVRGLGLRKIGDSVWIENIPTHLGMVRQVSFLLKVEQKEVSDAS